MQEQILGNRDSGLAIFSLMLAMAWAGERLPAQPAAAAATPAAQQQNVFPDGDFDKANARGQMPVWWGISGNASIVTADNGHKALRVTNDNIAAGGGPIYHFSLNPKWTAVTVMALVKTTHLKVANKDYAGADIEFHLVASQGMVGKGVLQLKQDSDWKELSTHMQIPENVTAIEILPSLWEATGTMEVENIRILAESTIVHVPPKDAVLPVSEHLTWGQEPIEASSSKRGEICLNGIWQFVPMLDPAETAPSGGLAYMHVPGSWRAHEGLPSLASRAAQGPAWRRFGNGEGTWCAWYVRKIKLPQAWAGRAVLLSLQRVSTDAIVYVNGKKCGAITWPSGEIDLTSAATPGGEDTLWIQVMASRRGPASAALNSSRVDLIDLYGQNGGQVESTRVDTKGLVGDVLLCSRPQGAHISDVFIQPSTRQKQLKVEVELSGAAAGPAHFIAHLMDEQGKEEKTFEADASVPESAPQKVTLSWPWANPRLWDVQQPNLYTLKLEAKGGGLNDEFAQSFGFREFWIEGRNFFMNGTEMHLRPTGAALEGAAGDSRFLIGNSIKGFLYAGWNMVSHGPYVAGERGVADFREMWADCADHLGLLQFIHLPNTPNNWDAAGKKQWQADVAATMRPYRNHPSVVLWGTNPNRFGIGGMDLDPRYIGRQRDISEPGFKRAAVMVREAIAMIKQQDPTRPLFSYSGDVLGDLYSINCYLNFEPLQEREDWLCEWAKSGDMPLQCVEFGTPWSASLMRGRWGQSGDTEPLMTEYCAIYLGPEAYALETDRYRGMIAKSFRGGQTYSGWPQEPLLVYAPAHQKLQALFIRNTYRSWRMWGISGGMTPWDTGWGWDEYNNKRRSDKAPFPPLSQKPPTFKPGDRGTFPQTGFDENLIKPYQPEGMQIFPAGEAMMAADGPTLAYIAGSAEAFTAKDHSFLVGQTVQKQVALLNDTRSQRDYTYSWKAMRGSTEIAHGQGHGKLAAGETKLTPFQFTAPKVTGAKADCLITLDTTIGTVKQTDSFPFRVFAKPAPARVQVAVFDPLGKTTKMLQAMGVTVKPWNGQGAAPATLVIGREAFSANQPALPFDLQALVRNGARVMICAQDPAWFERLGFRVAAHLPRRICPVSADNPVVQGLDAADLRNWSGTSTLVEPYPEVAVQNPPWRSPELGWHWGNRGVVSSAALEKPHLSGWRPILEGEFDLAYSPLMELDYGKGRLTLCTLDLEDHYAVDPAADLIGRQLVKHVASAPLAPRADNSVVYVGGAAGAALLDRLGVAYSKSTRLAPETKLLIVGVDGQVNLGKARALCAAGGQAIFLARQDAAGPLGVTLEKVSGFHGSLNPPTWPEARGLSASDLRWRADGDAWVVKDTPLAGCMLHVGANGLLGRVSFGSGGGAALICQIDPAAFNADKQTYFRLTRWRQTRSLAQLLANCGASFKADQDVFLAPRAAPMAALYHPDYRGFVPGASNQKTEAFNLSDNPYRFFRW
jgi:beta-galactosidase